jgi:ABC-type multidrug transport system ATPase subunit
MMKYPDPGRDDPWVVPTGVALRIRDLAKDHAGEKALNGVSFEVPEGALFGIIGADGAGKSTLLTILATLLDADSGEAEALGMDLKRDFRKLRSRIAFMPQRFSLYPDLSVAENLNFFADLYDFDPVEKQKRMAELLRFSALEPFQKRRAGLLSGGMKQKLALCCCLLNRPALLYLDEPTVGVDPVARRDFWILLKTLKSQGITLLISTPYMDEARLCDTLLLLHHGKVLASGTPVEMLNRYPYSLYRIRGSKPLHYSARQAPPTGVALVYPAGGELRAAVELGDSDREVWKLFPGAGESELVTPEVEDLFFALLSRESATLEEQISK